MNILLNRQMLFSRCNSLSYLKDRICERWAGGRGEASKMSKEAGDPQSECKMPVLLSSTLQLVNLCCYIPGAGPWGPWARWRESARQSAFMNGRRGEGRFSEQSRLCQGAPPRAGGSREQIAKAVTSALSYELTTAHTVFWGGTRVRICGRKRYASTDCWAKWQPSAAPVSQRPMKCKGQQKELVRPGQCCLGLGCATSPSSQEGPLRPPPCSHLAAAALPAVWHCENI